MTTTNDIEISATSYTSVSTGLDVLISNKSNYILRIQVAATQPDVTSTNGDLISPFPNPLYQKLIIDEAESVWLISTSGTAFVSVQEV